MMRTLVLAAVLPLGCVAARADAYRDLTATEQSVVATSVKRSLKDPESARFEWWPVFLPHNIAGKSTYCAVVNARNGFGGYTGPTLFSVSINFDTSGLADAGAVSFATDQPDSVNDRAIRHCVAAGYRRLPGFSWKTNEEIAAESDEYLRSHPLPQVTKESEARADAEAIARAAAILKLAPAPD